MKIYCVEDEEEIRNLIIYALTSVGYEVEGFSESAPFWDRIKDNQPDLILLDIMLPGEDGIAILKKLKASEKYENIPVIMSTAKGTEYDKVIGLDLGADDYLTKPFGMMEMISRIKAVLRRSHKTEKVQLKNGPIIMNLDRHQVEVNGEKIILTLKEFDLLKLFLNNIEIVFTRDQLLDQIWGMDYVGESRTVDVHVGTLRTKLGEIGSCIETLRGVGYRMVKIVEEENI
ncbi:MAG: response regulator transcription factor [Christensenella sp.]|nr:response regulator transcription factor [Christensenella sp.]